MSNTTKRIPLAYERLLWVTAILLYGIGDLTVTTLGLHNEDVAEAGPVALFMIRQAGLSGLVLLKAVLFALCFSVWTFLESPGRSAIPLALTVVGFLVILWNLWMLYI